MLALPVLRALFGAWLKQEEGLLLRESVVAKKRGQLPTIGTFVGTVQVPWCRRWKLERTERTSANCCPLLNWSGLEVVLPVDARPREMHV
jgi:hypothetical protein